MKRLVLLAGCALISACSGIAMKDGKQPINIVTRPEGAQCSIKKKDVVLGDVVSPGIVYVSLDDFDPLEITCSKTGYKTVTQLNHRNYEDNVGSEMLIMSGGAIGGAIGGAMQGTPDLPLYYWGVVNIYMK